MQKHPGAHDPLARAVGSLVGAALVAFAAIGALTIWHLIRRGRLIRERLAPPRAVRLPEIEIEARTAETPNQEPNP